MTWYNPASWFRADSGDSIGGAGDDFWYQAVPTGGGAKTVVTPVTAMQASVVYACIKVISESIGQLPFNLFRREEGGDKSRLDTHPLFDVLHEQPNDEHTSQEWREMMVAHAAWRGTAYSEILPGRRGAVDQLIPIHPDWMNVERVKDNSGRLEWRFTVREPGARPRVLSRDDLFILRAMPIGPGGMEGLDPIRAQKRAIGTRIASQDFSARFLENDATPPTVVKHPNHFKEEADKKRWINAWQEGGTGGNRGKVRVLEYGMDIQQLSINQEQAQFLETQKYQDVDIARIFRVQPHKVGILDRATFSNIEQQSIEFVVDTLAPWLTRVEKAVKRDLIRGIQRDDRTMFAEHNVLGLLRGDTLARFQAYAIGRNWGWMSANDVRRAENMNSLDENGDIYMQPLNMKEAGDPAEPSGMGRPTNGSGQAIHRPGDTYGH